MVKIIVSIALCLWYFGYPSHIFAQSQPQPQPQTQTQNSFLNSLEQNKSSSNEPLDLSLDSGQKQDENKSSSNKIQKIEPNKTKFNSSEKNKKSSNYGKAKVPGNEFKASGALLGGTGQHSKSSESSAVLPLSSYLNDNKIENSLDKSLKSGITRKAKTKTTVEDETLIGKKKRKKIKEEDMQRPRRWRRL